jgi:fido (protein-threonine AMPylation protein)
MTFTTYLKTYHILCLHKLMTSDLFRWEGRIRGKVDRFFGVLYKVRNVKNIVGIFE